MKRQRVSASRSHASVVKNRRYGALLIKSSVIALLSATIVWGIIQLQDLRSAQMKWLNISGDYHFLSRTDIQSAIAPLLDESFFSLNVAEVKARVLQLPWVAAASVRKVWPGTLEIKFVEQRAVARWGDQGYLNEGGELFQPSSEPALIQLPELVGPEEQRKEVLMTYKQFSQQLASLHLHIARLTMSARNAWRMVLDNGIEVILGRTDVNLRLQRFVTVYPEEFAARPEQVDYVDMRYPNGMAVMINSSGALARR